MTNVLCNVERNGKLEKSVVIIFFVDSVDTVDRLPCDRNDLFRPAVKGRMVMTSLQGWDGQISAICLKKCF